MSALPGPLPGSEPGQEFTILRLAPAQLDEIEAIEQRSYPTPWSRNMFTGELAKPTSVCLGAFDRGDGRLLGYVIASRYVDAWHVMNVCVDPVERGRGIALALLQRFIAMTEADGKRGYTLEVRVSNEREIRLYEGLGFVNRGSRRAYYTDNREDAIVMWRDEPEEA